MKTPASAWVVPPVQPLLIRDLLTRVRHWAGGQRIIYRDLREHSYAEFLARVDRLGRVLTDLGVKPGDRVGVLDCDSHRYLELFFAVPMLGAVLHTVNVRLTPEQIAYTIRHAADSVMLVHTDFLPLAAQLAPQLPDVQAWVALTDGALPADPGIALAGEYEALLAGVSSEFCFPDLDENTVATLFYTTGTTGEPKGVYFTHRQLVLHTLALGLNFSVHHDPLSLQCDDVYLPLTPMFHVHAWGFPYLATLLGLTQVYAGRFEPALLLRLIARHKVTISHGVPTVLQLLLNHPESAGVDLSNLKLVVGGAPLPAGLARQARARGIRLLSSYGMSETCPVVASAHPKPDRADTDAEADLEVCSRTGFPLPLVEAGIWSANGTLLPPGRDQIGELVLRAPWLTGGYHLDPVRSAELWRGGWLHTGDIAYRDLDGYVRITDRLKDVIKIGGEWISSLELENALSRHEAVKEVAVVGVPNAKWDERPHADVVLHPAHAGQVTPRELQKFLHGFIESGAIHQRAVLTEIRLVEAIPRTSVGKIDKKALRAALVAAAAST